jgi:TonB family protein
MSRNCPGIFLVVSLALLPAALRAQDALESGIAAYRHNDYDRALSLLRQATANRPDQAAPHVYLGATYRAMAIDSGLLYELLQNPEGLALIPEADRAAAAKSAASTPETERLAEAEFRRALELDGNNVMALEGLVDLAYHGHMATGPEKDRRLAEAEVLNDRLAVAFADDELRKLAESLDEQRRASATRRIPDGMMGTFTESTVRQILQRADHSGVGIDGPLPNPMRKTLQTKLISVINDAFADFQQQLRLDPLDDGAMIEMSYLIRDRAALRDTKAEYSSDIALADAWMNRGFDTRAEKAQGTSPGVPATRSSPSATAARVRVTESEQEAKSIRSVALSYPPAAIQAHVSGTVRFRVTIGRNGRVKDAQPISGNPILFDTARDALKQWMWQATIVNGLEMEVDTEVEVGFSPN